jgi:hypothetical protein
MNGYIYFICDKRNQVKIGFSADPWERLKQLQTGSTDQLSLIAWVGGATRTTERVYHKCLQKWHVRGEWFNGKSAAIRNLVEAIKRGATPRSVEAIVFHGGFKFAERNTPPPGFGSIMGEVRAAHRAGTLDSLRGRDGMYPAAIAALERSLTRRRPLV